MGRWFQHNGIRVFNLTGRFPFIGNGYWKTGYNRPFIWNPISGETTELHLPDISGDLSVMDWSPDGKRVLLARTNTMARQNLAIYELATCKLFELKHPGGFYGIGMTFASTAHLMDGEIMAVWQDAANPPQLIALDSLTGRKKRTVLPAGAVPPGRPWKNITFKSTDEETIQAWLGLPEYKGPIPYHSAHP